MTYNVFGGKLSLAQSINPENTGQVCRLYDGHRVKVKKKTSRKSIFPYSIAHNSRSITDRAIRFACIMGFSDTADRMAVDRVTTGK